MATTKKRKKKSPTPRTAPGGFSSRERCIFAYWDGVRQVEADPLEVQARLLDAPDFDVAMDFKIASLTTEEPMVQQQAIGAYKRIVGAVRHAFNVQPFANANGKRSGLTGAECMALLQQFGVFMDDLKKKLAPSPTSASATGPASWGDGSVTLNSSACTSTAPASCTAGPCPSPSGPDSPSAGTPPATSGSP